MLSRTSVLSAFFLVCAFGVSASAQSTNQVSEPQEQPSSQQVQQNDAQQQSIAKELQDKTDAIRRAIEAHCNYKPDETDPKKIRKTNACINNAIRIHRQKVRLNDSLRNTAEAEAIMEERSKVGQQLPQTIVKQLRQPAPIAGIQPGAGSGSPQPFVGGSLTGTPTTCGTGSGFNSSLIRVHRVVMTPQVASDDFGHRLGRKFVIYQVTVENGSKDFQFMLQDVSVDFSRQFNQPFGTYSYNASGQDLTLLRGVPEKGEDLDPRNLVLHMLQGIGSVAGAVSGLTSFSDVMGPSVAVFNGSFLQGFTAIAPDHTGTQLNRLSDSAFTANTVIDKQRAKTIAMFVPADEVLSQSEQKDFRKDPNMFLGFGDQTGVLSQADVCVDGTFVQAVTVAAPTLSAAVLAKNPAPAANVDTVLTVTGSNLVAGDTQVVVGTGAAALVVTTDGKTGTAQVHLPPDYVNGTTTATLQSKSNPSLTSGAVKMTIAP
jgi:hypothetical protein